jgi:hypothetical protein
VSKRIAAVLGSLLLATPALSQQSGWSYSPFPGEGDRATLGCSRGATATEFTCLAVRCEDDFTAGIHIHTSRPGGDTGSWVIEFDKEGERFPVTAAPDGTPYNARLSGDIEAILDRLKNAGLVFLDPPDGASIDQGIPLTGSLYAINKALYFCAPRTPPSGDEVTAVDR